ncbi:XRE family transcriptional regulator [Segetibacter sp. 3557_3]|uniref:helix-turn-helix transcriptional regulator n=1 Tax=Segetibacter sp. 3557_3 TaxID=2547429 RepID=UPI00105855B9|nr:helix-turn-helix transcriptional regulator [Segetibacter sp. 3557_3]TDH18144.1 XRE family transcriptional regulator [Segetibacter sp. 3557_3]
MTTSTSSEQVHHGRNIKRLREMLGIKQEALALSLGEDWSQKKVSRLEDKEVIEDEVLQAIGKALHITPEAIKNFDEQAAVNYFNSFHDSSGAGAFFSSSNYNCTFNPLDKMVELYERMLREKNEMIEKLERLLQDRK